ncbi:MAG: IS701 family transposase [Pyrinomonadaceae bacterium]
MQLAQFNALEKQLGDFVEQFGGLLGRSERRYWCKQYLTGLLLDGERKSVEPMAERVAGGDAQAMQQFVNQSPWAHEALQLDLARLMLRRRAGQRARLVLDDTTLPKQGKASVGVARQYCGALGKVANCQSVVTWHYADAQSHFPLLGRLYLPQVWTSDAERMGRAGVPTECQVFREKWKIALELLDELKPEVAPEVIVCDAGYGEVKEFLHELDHRGQVFVAQVPESHSFWPADVAVTTAMNPTGRPRRFPQVADPQAQPLRARQWRERVEREGRKWQKVRLPLRQPKTVEIVALRVRETNTQAWRRPGAERWLLIERLSDGTVKYYLSNAGRRASVRQLMLWAHERWKIEQGYQQLKEELGLDHFEGRSWRGLHHHLTLCFMAYCFLQLMKRGKKKLVDVTADEAVAQSGAGTDAVSGVSQLSSRTKSRAVRLHLSYLT